jgi:hypothetical protein
MVILFGAGLHARRGSVNRLKHDPEKHALDVIGDGRRFSDKIMLKQEAKARWR